MGMKFLKKLRIKKGFTSQYQMAHHLKMLENSYRYLENKAKGCELRTLVQIKEKLGMTWGELGKLIEEEARGDSEDESES